MYRTAFMGSPRWIRSTQVREARADPRFITVWLGTCDAVLVGRWPSATDYIALIQTGCQVERAIQVVAALSAGHTSVRCVAVIPDDDEETIRRCIEADVWGRVLEDASAGEYGKTIVATAAGRLSYPPPYLDRIETRSGRMTLAEPAQPQGRSLTDDEKGLLALLADGLTTAQAAGTLNIHLSDAQRLRRRLMRKIDARNQASLIRFAIRAGLVDP